MANLARTDWSRPDKLRAARLMVERDDNSTVAMVLGFATANSQLGETRALDGGTGLSSNTVQNYDRYCRKFVAWAFENRNGLAGIDEADFRAYAESMFDAGMKKATVALALSVARSVLRALEWNGMTGIQKIGSIKLRGADGQRRAHDVDAFRAAVRSLQDRPQGDLTALVVLLVGLTGLRVSEAVGLKWTDVDLASGRIVVRCGKGGRPRSSAIPRQLRAVLCPPAEASSTFVLGGIDRHKAYELVRKWQDEHGLTGDRGPHVLRHTFAHWVLAETGNLKIVQNALGHARLATTDRYLRGAEAERTQLAIGGLEA